MGTPGGLCHLSGGLTTGHRQFSLTSSQVRSELDKVGPRGEVRSPASSHDDRVGLSLTSGTGFQVGYGFCNRLWD